MTTLDDTDRRILLALDRDPRATVAQLALTLGLARGTVHSRLERLSAERVLRANSTRLDPGRVGLPMRALVKAGVEQSEFTGKLTAGGSSSNLIVFRPDAQPDLSEISQERCILMFGRSSGRSSLIPVVAGSSVSSVT